jgi:hypothetical protein
VERAAREVEKSATKSSRRSALIAAGSMVVTSVVLAAAFFPLMFNRWLPRDDEGVFQYALRDIVTHHGHLYDTISADLYGPFYYFFMSTIYRVMHQQPTLASGRWIVLILTAASGVLFGGAVWRVTKSLPSSLVCQVATFLILIPIAGNEPMHPGSLEVFLVAAVAFGLASYSASRRTLPLVFTGIATGALIMTKVNAGGLVAVAIVFGLLVGSAKIPRWIQIVVAALTVLVPIGLVFQNIDQTWVDTFALLVIGSIAAMFVLMSIDQLPVARWSLVPIAAGAAGAILFSLAFPLVSGTPLSAEIKGVFIRPLTFSDKFTGPAIVSLDWFAFVLTVAGIGAAIAFRSASKDTVRAQASWLHATLAGFALWILGLAVTTYVAGYTTARWLPILVVLPAIAFCCEGSQSIRLALRLTVVLAILQVLVAYPVAGSQVGWGTVAVGVPCAIALAAGVDYSRAWRESGVFIRGGATAFVCIAIIVAMGMMPTTIWKAYADTPSFGLPGTGLMRVDPAAAAPIREAVRQIRAHCDTFYGVPNLNSFYVFTGLPAVTGIVVNGGPAGLTAEQQRQVIDALAEKTKAGQRVCILRDSSQGVVLTPGPFADALNQYVKVVASSGTYTIARHS